jgi:hypothetical protein
LVQAHSITLESLEVLGPPGQLLALYLLRYTRACNYLLILKLWEKSEREREIMLPIIRWKEEEKFKDIRLVNSRAARKGKKKNIK